MDKREAKRDACFHASMMLEANLGAGWPFGSEFGGREITDQEAEKIVDGMNELISELWRRGAGSTAAREWVS